MNYAYALVRGVICRDLCVFGLEPALGLSHHNRLNGFNLADDLIEPFRGLVDKWVLKRCLFNKDNLDKQQIIKMLSCNVEIDGQFQSFSNAVYIMIESYMKCCKLKTSSSLKLPTLLSLSEHEFR
ncbi:CRISPR-associated endonuclease Cas1 [Holzapfeliella sp. JNUCC 80]